MSEPEFLDAPPDEPAVTDYDRRHLKLYARLLDARTAGATWEEAFRVLFHAEGSVTPARAREIHDAHLRRAEWMAETGFSELLSNPRN